MITVAPEVTGGLDLVRELKARGWVISIGHTRASVEVLDAACDAGAHHMTHFMNAMSPLHHRTPGPIAWGLSRDDVTFDLIADGIHLDPFMLRLLVKIKGPQGISLISDGIAGSVISMLDAVRVMRSLGVSWIDIAQMASLNPARLLGLDHECGSIEVGKRADLIAIDQSGQVQRTFLAT
jgi:N-acetylglucosamine-6-phosphate deacetylase